MLLTCRAAAALKHRSIFIVAQATRTMQAAADLLSVSKDDTGEYIVAATAVDKGVAVLTETGATHAEPTMHTIQASSPNLLESRPKH
jgi:hypothetical protein